MPWHLGLKPVPAGHSATCLAGLGALLLRCSSELISIFTGARAEPTTLYLAALCTALQAAQKTQPASIAAWGLSSGGITELSIRAA